MVRFVVQFPAHYIAYWCRRKGCLQFMGVLTISLLKRRICSGSRGYPGPLWSYAHGRELWIGL